MEIRQQYWQQYLHDIAVDQLMDDYRAKGYEVAKEGQVGNYIADLVAKKGEEVVVVEVKTGKMDTQRRKQVAALGDYIRTQKNYRFLVVLANPPVKKRIDIPQLEDLLSHYLIVDSPTPEVLDQLSKRAKITEVSDVNVNEVSVNENGSILVKGTGTINVDLEYGSHSDGASVYDSFPFTFEITLKHNQRNELVIVADAAVIDVDTSSFYD